MHMHVQLKMYTNGTHKFPIGTRHCCFDAHKKKDFILLVDMWYVLKRNNSLENELIFIFYTFFFSLLFVIDACYQIEKPFTIHNDIFHLFYRSFIIQSFILAPVYLMQCSNSKYSFHIWSSIWFGSVCFNPPSIVHH